MQLHALIKHLALQVRGPVLGHRRCGHVQLAFQMQGHALIDKHAANLNLGRHLRQLEPGVLEIGNRLAERLALSRVLEGPLQRRFG